MRNCWGGGLPQTVSSVSTRPETPRAPSEAKGYDKVVDIDCAKTKFAASFDPAGEIALPTLPVFSRTNVGLQSFSC